MCIAAIIAVRWWRGHAAQSAARALAPRAAVADQLTPTPPEFGDSAGPRATVGGVREVDWPLLRRRDARGATAAVVRGLDGRRVRIPGYLVPLDDGVDRATEFLVVPYFGACIHMPPPPPNQLVYARTMRGAPAEVGLYDPVWVEGRLHVGCIESAYGDADYAMDEVRVTP